MSTLVKKIRTHIGDDGKLDLNLSNLPAGDFEVVVYKMKKNIDRDKFMALIPRHKLGKILSSLRREDLYGDDAR